MPNFPTTPWIGRLEPNFSVCDITGRLLPTHPDESVIATVIEAVLRSQLRLVRKGRKAGISPFLPPLAKNRSFESIRAIDAPLHGKSLRAAARIPGRSHLVAIEIAIVLVVVALLAPKHDTIANESAKATHVCIIGGAHPGERVVVTVLVEINFLPVAIGVSPQRVLDA
jgi:hypothetical protein